MAIELRDYKPEFIPLQVALGSKIMENWKYNSQSTEEFLEKIYAKDNFQAKFKIYAFENNNLVGFQTSHLYDNDEEKYGRMEFPITDNEEVAVLLEEETERRFRDENVEYLKVRVSPHWGNTEKYANKFGFKPSDAHVMVATAKLSEISSIDREHPYDLISVYQNPEGIRLFKEIFPKRFPMRYDGEIDEWLKYYEEQQPVVWLILTEDDKPIGHVIGFGKDDNLRMTSLFSFGNKEGLKLKLLVSEAGKLAKEVSDLSDMSITFGDPQISYANDLETIGMKLKTEVSYYIKK